MARTSTSQTGSPPLSEQMTPPSSGSGQDVTPVAEAFVDLQRTVRRSKARLLTAAGSDIESATHLLLDMVAAEGPMRASALAAGVHADLSTVSRQVAALVNRGLLERCADQLDGRASLLAVTSAGRAVVAEHGRRRQAFFDRVLSDWSDEELRQFAQQMQRFTVAYDRAHTAWMSERTPHPDSPTRAIVSAGKSTSDPHRPIDRRHSHAQSKEASIA